MKQARKILLYMKMQERKFMVDENKIIRIIITGGGTGGHVFPAIAIADNIKDHYKNVRLLFVGAKNKIEMHKVPEAGYEIIGLNVMGWPGKAIHKAFIFFIKFAFSYFKAGRILRRFRPDVIIGVGGYASAPMLYRATKMKIPAVIQEQNSFPGKVNRWLAEKVDKICVAYNGMEKYFPKNKIYLTGNPVRKIFQNLADKRNESQAFFNLSPNFKTLLVIGGSQGALSINKAVSCILPELKNRKIQLIWQTGKTFFEEAQSLIQKELYQNVAVYKFIERMDFAYAASDCIVSRAGAISISEIIAAGKPSILIPFPFAAGDHQTRNALGLVNQNAAVMIEDEWAEKKLATELFNLMEDENKLQRMQENISNHFFGDAASHIRVVIFDLIKKKIETI